MKCQICRETVDFLLVKDGEEMCQECVDFFNEEEELREYWEWEALQSSDEF